MLPLRERVNLSDEVHILADNPLVLLLVIL